MSRPKERVLLIEWENFEQRIPQSVEVLSPRQANRRAAAFREKRRRRADVISLKSIAQ